MSWSSIGRCSTAIESWSRASAAVVEFVARQVQVSADALRGYEFSERTDRYHRAQIRAHFGFRECTVEDARGLQAWLAENVAEADPRHEVVRDQLLDRCRRWRVEPPSERRIDRIVRGSVHGAQTALVLRRLVPADAAELRPVHRTPESRAWPPTGRLVLLVAPAGPASRPSCRGG
jgi:hypothetical protein